ncbi:hypothetical protein NPIL_329221 [Nephila pilipes]|uniref:Uncharacterized protein n=1 Tax=Nephila pilipes TaxID=299642 RepID=A0A8X6UAY2_NEPPI|nr:hypothetical protein NPIL_329221 [Nephila pilipes]
MLLFVGAAPAAAVAILRQRLDAITPAPPWAVGNSCTLPLSAYYGTYQFSLYAAAPAAADQPAEWRSCAAACAHSNIHHCAGAADGVFCLRERVWSLRDGLSACLRTLGRRWRLNNSVRRLRPPRTSASPGGADARGRLGYSILLGWRNTYICSSAVLCSSTLFCHHLSLFRGC